MPSTFLAVALLLSVPFVGLLSNAVLIPVLPKMAAALHLPFRQVAWLIVIPSIVAAVCIPIGGYLSDRWTRTAVLAPSLLLYGLAGLVGGLSPFLTDTPFPLLLFVRFLQGIGYAGTIVLVIALAGDLFEPSRRSQVLGLIETANALGKASGPLMGAALGSIAWFAPFFVFPALAIPIAVLLWRFLGRLPRAKEPRPTLAAFMRHVWATLRPRFTALVIIFFTGFWGVNVILLLLTLLSRDLPEGEVRPLVRGLLITIPEVAVGLAAGAAGRWLRGKGAVGGRWLMLGGLTFMALGLAAAAVAHPPWLLVGAAALAGLGAGTVLASSNVLLTSAVSEGERGVVASVYGAFRAFGVAIVPGFFALSAALQDEPSALWIMSGAVGITGALVALYLVPERLEARGS